MCRWLCRSGMGIMIRKDHIFKLWMGSGKGNNTKVELIRLWGVIHFVDSIGIDSIKILGDSKVITEWDLGRYKLHMI